MKKIHIHDSIYHIVNTYPECLGILDSLGFHEIKKVGMVHTIGKYMNLEKGCKLRKIDIQTIEDTLLENNIILVKEKTHEY